MDLISHLKARKLSQQELMQIAGGRKEPAAAKSRQLARATVDAIALLSGIERKPQSLDDDLVLGPIRRFFAKLFS